MLQAQQQLSDDHQAVGEVVTQLLTALKNKDVKASHSKLDLLWARLAVHIRAEHLHLFPAVTRRFTEAQSVVETLRADHDFFMTELARAVNTLRQPPTEEEINLNSILDVILEVEKRLAKHNEIEEHQIYRFASTMLTEAEQVELATRINAELEHRPSRFSAEAWANKLSNNL
jgi:hemerythrin superfamily protein